MDAMKLQDQKSEKLVLTLQDKMKPAVLSQAGNATEEGAPGAGVQTRELDGAIHPDEQ